MDIGRLRYVDMNPSLDRQSKKRSSRRNPSPIQHSTSQVAPLAGDPAVEPQEQSSPNTEVDNTRENIHQHTRKTYPMGPLHRLPDTHTDKAYMSLEEACLIRHFETNLGPWVCTIRHDHGVRRR